MSKPELKVVVPIGCSNLSDITAMLRSTADRIERGELGEPSLAVVVIDSAGDEYDEGPTIFGFGPSAGDRLKAIGLLYLGMHSIVP